MNLVVAIESEVPEMTTRSLSRPALDVDIAQVVTPVDFTRLSWKPVGLAGALAERFGATHRLVHVETTSGWEPDDSAPKARAEASHDGINAEIELVAAATPAEGILRALADARPSLLVLATHAHTAAAETVLGSTAARVAKEWRGPTIVVGPHYQSVVPLQRILVCIDPVLALPKPLLADVRAWSAALDLPVAVLAVTSDSFPRERAHNERLLADAAALVSLPGREVTVLEAKSGSVPGNIVTFADAQPGTLIALATHAPRRASRLLLGSVTAAVCRRTESAVLTRRVVYEGAPDD
jgi:nucleotide-binding universal stress UspA family protein